MCTWQEHNVPELILFAMSEQYAQQYYRCVEASMLEEG